jgi:ParB-like chromosome segregation protein Spo0J
VSNRIEDIELALIEPFSNMRDPDAVKQCVKLLRKGQLPPPIWVWEIPGAKYRYRVCDGMHRITAAKMLGHKKISARICYDEFGFAQWQRERRTTRRLPTRR